MPPVYLCHGDENDCDDHATCTHTGPGTHDCACFLRYGGDGQTCAEQGVAQCLPDCTLQVLCPALPPLDGATIEYSNGMISPSVATYTCDATGGAPIDGDATRECQDDGSWSGVAPTQCDACGQDPSDCMTERGCITPGGRCIAFTCGIEDAQDQCALYKGDGWRTVTLAEHFEGGFCEDTIEHMWQPHLCTGSSMCGSGTAGCTSIGDCTGGDSPFYVMDSGNSNHLRYVGPRVDHCSDAPCNQGVGVAWGRQGGDNDDALRMLICIKE